MEPWERRMTENETLFREVNERVRSIAAAHGDDEHVYEFYCECANSECTVQVAATLAAYERVRAEPRQFIVAPQHSLPEIERVVARTETWWVVRKEGDAARLAEEKDPRAPP